MRRVLHAASDAIDAVVRWATVATTTAFTLLIFVAVLTRYVFDFSILWSVEVSKLLFVWSAFLAATIAFKRHAHIRFEFLNRVFGPKGLALTDLLLYVSCAVFFTVLLRESIGFTRIVWPTFLPVLSMSQGWLYVSVIASSVIFLVHTCRWLADSIAAVRAAFRNSSRGAEEVRP